MKQQIRLSSLLIILCFFGVNGQLKTAVDSLSVQIGAQLNYTLQVKADSTDQVLFPSRTSFLPFEILEEFPVDTLKAKSHYLFTKKYALIQFDSGRYWLSRQPVIFNQQTLLSDSIQIEVRDVVVDTLKQKLYDIKPLIEVERNYDQFLRNLLWAVFLLVLGLGAIFSYFKWQQEKAKKTKKRPPFDQAIHDLKSLENQTPSNQEEYKMYYSELTDIVRRYLEEEAKIDALESTSDELLQKLMLLQDTGKITLQTDTLKNLDRVLSTADLVKFARSLPDYGVASLDRNLVEEVVIDTQKGLPEPTFEEMQQKAAYQKFVRQQRRKKQLRVVGWSSLGLLTVSLLTAILLYGYYPVRDTLLGYPTKVLENKSWVTSMYGMPPLKITTPEVLKRVESIDPKAFKHFVMGTPDTDFFLALKFIENEPQTEQSTEESAAPNSASEEQVQALLDQTIQAYQALGATNILMNSEVVTTASGLPALKIFGTLAYLRKGEKDRIRNKYTSLIFDFKEGKIELTLMYAKDDRYGGAIEKRILDSVELIQQL